MTFAPSTADLRLVVRNGWFTLGLRKAEQSLKTGLFYYDEFPRPVQPVPAPALLSPKIFTLWRELLSRALSSDGVQVLCGYNSGRWCFYAFAQHFREEEQY